MTGLDVEPKNAHKGHFKATPVKDAETIVAQLQSILWLFLAKHGLTQYNENALIEAKSQLKALIESEIRKKLAELKGGQHE